MRRFTKVVLTMLGLGLVLSACSAYTSITREANGNYVITGWDSGPSGFILTCKYDPNTRTLTILEKTPR